MSQRQHNVRQNSFWLFSARVTVQILSVVFSAIVARKLGVDEFGQYAFIASLVFIGNTVTSFGTDTYLVREVARTNEVGDIASRSLALQLFLTCLYIAAMLFIPRTGLFIFALTLLPMTMISVNGAIFRAFGRMDFTSYVGVFSVSIQAVAAFLADDVLTLCYYLLIQHLIVMGLSYILSRRGSFPTFSLFPLKDFRPIFKLVLPFAALTILLVLIQRLGLIFVSLFLGDSSAGFFSSATRIVDGLKLGHYAILGALLPAISTGTTRSWQSFRKAFVLLISGSFALALFTTIFSSLIILILFGDEFKQVSGYLSVMVWSLLPYTVSSFTSYALIARGHEIHVMKLVFVSVLIDVALYLWLIQTYGLIGAVWASILGDTVRAIIFGVYYVRFPNQSDTPANIETNNYL